MCRLDQKDAIELMQLEVSSEIQNRVEIKNRLGKADKRNVCSLWDPVHRLNDVVR